MTSVRLPPSYGDAVNELRPKKWRPLRSFTSWDGAELFYRAWIPK